MGHGLRIKDDRLNDLMAKIQLDTELLESVAESAYTRGVVDEYSRNREYIDRMRRQICDLQATLRSVLHPEGPPRLDTKRDQSSDHEARPGTTTSVIPHGL